jgi:hypothetical protein
VGEGKEEGRYFRLASGPQLPSPNMAMETHPLKTVRGAKSYRIVGERDLSVSAKDLFFGDIRRRPSAIILVHIGTPSVRPIGTPMVPQLR